MRMTTAALTLRRAGLEDGPFLLTVRNEDSVRSQSKSQELISEETHKNWLERHLGSSETAIWIIERESQKLGYVRAQKIDHPGKTGRDCDRQPTSLPSKPRREAATRDGVTPPVAARSSSPSHDPDAGGTALLICARVT